MKLNILQLICLINYVFTFPIFDELWETNQTEPQANPIESQPKIKVEPREEQFDGRWQDESALKRNVKVEHEPHFGAVKVEGKDKIKHEFEWWGKEIGVKEEDQDGQDPNTSDHKKIGDDDEYWEKDEDDSAPTTDDLDQENSNKHLSDQNNSTDQDENVDEQQNEKLVQKLQNYAQFFVKERS
uniref:Uncharacterized protein n=1 Tax=Globodera rostochiensis TaxID=31243 RepID=A0A914GUB4_GLORO